jgi:chemotaxis protein CheD
MIETGPDIQEQTPVGLGEIVVTDNPKAFLVCSGLGSCIGVCAYDEVARIGGMAHIVLPSGENAPENSAGPAKFAGTGVPALVGEVIGKGALQSRLHVKIAGGASMVTDPGFADHFRTGERNVRAVKEAFSKLGIKILASEVGGHHGRTLKMCIATGEVIVEFAGKSTIKL